MRDEGPDSTMSRGYPFGDDVEWVAVDRWGRVGIFTTGGVGPIPRAYLEAPEAFQQVKELIWRSPECTEATLLTNVRSPDDFVAFARRGFFAFDWADVHRVRDQSGRYELQARPLVPLGVGLLTWPDGIRSLVEGTEHADLDFGQPFLDVTPLDCESAS